MICCHEFLGVGSLSAMGEVLGSMQGWLALLGRLHVVVIHFPIALLLMAAAGEAWRWLGRRAPWIDGTLYAGAAGAVMAALLGWLRVLVGGYDGGGETLLLHEWLGTGAAVVAIAAAMMHWAGIRRPRWRGVAAGVLMVAALGAGTAGHFGGTLVHGSLLSGE